MLFKDINIPNLDNRLEETLVEEARLSVYNSTAGKLNDFSAGSPFAVLLEAQAFVASELLYYVNKLVPTTALQYYKNVGVQRRLGTQSTVKLTFVLRDPSINPTTIPAGFQITSSGAGIVFRTDDTLVIPSGASAGIINATSVLAGKATNVAAYSISNISQPITNLDRVFNEEASQGGTDTETVQETIERGNVELRVRGLVSNDDYERTAENIIGEGSRFKSIGNLSADKESYQLGSVHLFGIDSNGEPLNEAQQSLVYNQLYPNKHTASSLYVSGMDVVDIDVDVVIILQNNYLSSEVSFNVASSVAEYINPSTIDIGHSLLLSEVEYSVRKVPGVKNVQQVLLNNNHLNVPVNNEFTVPRFNKLDLLIINSNNIQLLRKTYYRGEV